MPPSILVLGYSEAGMLLGKPNTANVRALITIRGRRESALDVVDIAHSLSLEFDDVEAPGGNDPLQAARIGLRQREAAELGLALTRPTIEHARAIVDFARSIVALDGTVLCQCQGGISRSSAAALLCLAAWSGSGHEERWVARLLQIRPSAVPHRGLVAFADELLGCGGKLVSALDRARPF